jgi:hypothetical protein
VTTDSHEPNPALSDETTRETLRCAQQLGDLGDGQQPFHLRYW